ncbi:anti-sigma factor family protein [Stutzerimonas stutzeri]|uniref:anti-sigma factor family protein n=1 Tax=Stutzerimonas stutzeri TaxID=316 RepID=UPI00210D8C9A|nr:zf-HC2 domain-containing protein [Stutzerimonas stutzeri]MCQ4242429.1 zf-HC2 domain-containing protein [Stutzerimonas stutzeri]
MTEHLDMASLSAYLDNELDAAKQRHADAHLAVCPQCRATLAELDGLGQGLRALVCPELPAGLQARLQRPFAPPPARSCWWARHWAQGIGAAASVLLGLLLGYALPGQPPGSSPSHDLLAVLGSAPPGALCARPELCYLKVNLK